MEEQKPNESLFHLHGSIHKFRNAKSNFQTLKFKNLSIKKSMKKMMIINKLLQKMIIQFIYIFYWVMQKFLIINTEGNFDFRLPKLYVDKHFTKNNFYELLFFYFYIFWFSFSKKLLMLYLELIFLYTKLFLITNHYAYV